MAKETWNDEEEAGPSCGMDMGKDKPGGQKTGGKKTYRNKKRQRSVSPDYSLPKKFVNSFPSKEAVLYSNTHIYVKNYMREMNSEPLLDFTIIAKDGFFKTNQVFMFLLGGEGVLPIIKETFISLDVELASVRFIMNFLYSNNEVSEQFSEVSLFLYNKKHIKVIKKNPKNLDIIPKNC